MSLSRILFKNKFFLKMALSIFSNRSGQFDAMAFESLMDSIFNQQSSPIFTSEEKTSKYPKADILESDSSIKILLEVPFLTKEDLELKVEDGILSIIGKKREIQEFEGFKTVRKEIKRSSFVRKFVLTETLNPKTISSEFKDGYLIIEVEKFIKDSEKNFSIEIK